jgi:hypothetical protein
MRERVVVTLVHGTWGRGIVNKKTDSTGLWFDQRSTFARGLRSRFARYSITPEFLHFIWSGSNSIAARSVAARSLAAHLTEAFKNEPSCLHLVIAHSHGGNVALLASKMYENSQLHIDPKMYENSRLHIVTLATPFAEVYANSFDVNFVRYIFVTFSTWVLGWTLYVLLGGPHALTGDATISFFVSFGLAYAVSYGAYKVLIRATPFEGMSEADFQASWSSKLLVLRGIDDEASLILAAGAIGNRIFRLATNYLTIIVMASFFLILTLAILGIKNSVAQDWLATAFLAFPVAALGVVMSSGIFKSTVGRELFFHGLTVEANVQSTPDVGPNTEMTVKTLRAIDKKMRHKLYDHPDVCNEIVDCNVRGSLALGHKAIEELICSSRMASKPAHLLG